MRFLIFCDVNRFESGRPAAFSATMKAYGKLIGAHFFFFFPGFCVGSANLFTCCTSSFWSRLSPPLPVFAFRGAELQCCLSGKRRRAEKHLVGSSQPVVQSTACSRRCIFPPASFIPLNKPIKTNYSELLLSSESTFLSKFYVLNFSQFIPPHPRFVNNNYVSTLP